MEAGGAIRPRKYNMKSDSRYPLYRHSDGTWHVGRNIGGIGSIKSVSTDPCPESNSHWEYLDSISNDGNDGDYGFLLGGFGSFRSGDITVKCSVHT